VDRRRRARPGGVRRALPGPWLDATVNRAEGRAVDRRVRSDQLARVDDAALADELLARLRPRLPARLMGMTLSGIKARLRCYRYRTGEHFGPHGDPSYPGGPGADGLPQRRLRGRTDRVPRALDRVISPRRGRALLFQHMVLHEGRAATRGSKYVLRSDVLYRADLTAGARP
jgi:prolyl 4-hydroxylase